MNIKAKKSASIKKRIKLLFIKVKINNNTAYIKLSTIKIDEEITPKRLNKKVSI